MFLFFSTCHMAATCTYMLLTSDHLRLEICFLFHMNRYQNLSSVLSSYRAHPLQQADVIIKSHLFLRVGLGRTCVRLFFLQAPNVEKKKQASSSEDWLGNRRPWSIHSQSTDFSTRGLSGEKTQTVWAKVNKLIQQCYQRMAIGLQLLKRTWTYYEIHVVVGF